jgi:hypothetical protein
VLLDKRLQGRSPLHVQRLCARQRRGCRRAGAGAAAIASRALLWPQGGPPVCVGRPCHLLLLLLLLPLLLPLLLLLLRLLRLLRLLLLLLLLLLLQLLLLLYLLLLVELQRRYRRQLRTALLQRELRLLLLLLLRQLLLHHHLRRRLHALLRRHHRGMLLHQHHRARESDGQAGHQHGLLHRRLCMHVGAHQGRFQSHDLGLQG